MLNAFRIPSAQIALGSVFGGFIHADHPVGTAHHAMTAPFAVFDIDLHGTGLLVSFDEVMRAGVQTDTALYTHKRCVYGGLAAQNMDHRPINVDHSFPLE